MKAPRLMIAAPSSGNGKTTISIGIMAALTGKMTVQGFKVGPDYIDPHYHSIATGRFSRNLDTWMMSINQIEEIFYRGQQEADMSVIEGVMGLFDGVDGKSEQGSSAEVAKILNTPVILVIDVRAMVRSAGALALGFKAFDPDLHIAGIIANRVGSPKHAEYIKDTIESVGIPLLGCIPRKETLKVPERHLGLVTAGERDIATREFIQHARQVIENNLNMGLLISIAESAPTINIPSFKNITVSTNRVRIAVARDEAFSFYYQDNFDLLEAAGAEIVLFSPLRDAHLPDAIAGLYLGGGYPELYVEEIAQNTSLRNDIYNTVSSGMPAYAECGGLMILTKYFIDRQKIEHSMIGVLPGFTRMTGQLKMGYREAVTNSNTLFLEKGDVVRGHEFHYSEWIRDKHTDPYPYDIKSRCDNTVQPEGYSRENLLASYIHLHFGTHPSIAPNFVKNCVEWKENFSGDIQ